MQSQTIKTAPDVTVIVLHRDRFSLAVESLKEIIAATHSPYNLLYVDAGSPRKVAAELKHICDENGFRYERSDALLSPAQSRNRGLRLADTKYVAFVESCTFVADNWLQELIKCADETGAEVVQPLMCQSKPFHNEIHQAGGTFAKDVELFFRGAPEDHVICDIHAHQGKQVTEVPLVRTETQVTEVHCFLVRRDTFERFGDFDESMLSTKDHLNFSMTVWKNGGRIMLQPTSVATFYVPSRHNPIHLSDYPFFILRWSPKWQADSLNHFKTKWGLEGDPYFQQRTDIITWRYHEAILKPFARRIPFIGRSYKVQKIVMRALEPVVVAWSLWLAKRHEKTLVEDVANTPQRRIGNPAHSL
ncbi:glycosyltransferase family 2 protein [Hyphomonas sp.]|uniref:glycosyltransferase family 2 protein n=1 Tax=Hyphomonas sp. TaxID=87 RepID=UPI0030F94CDB